MAVSPSMTFNTAGNLRASATVIASGTFNFDWDLSAKFAGLMHVKDTTGTVAGTSGLQIQVFRNYGSSPTAGQSAILTLTVAPGASATLSLDIQLGPGKYHIVGTNLDASNAITVEVTGDTVDSVG